jgi:hypothetical protein
VSACRRTSKQQGHQQSSPQSLATSLELEPDPILRYRSDVYLGSVGAWRGLETRASLSMICRDLEDFTGLVGNCSITLAVNNAHSNRRTCHGNSDRHGPHW